MIDPRSYTPVYRQLAELLRAQIDDGTLAPGALLPAEHRLAQMHGVGRDTVRAALAALRSEGLIETRDSAGSRVRREREREEYSLQRTSRMVMRMPTMAERIEHDIDEGVPVGVVRYGARTILLIGDRVEIVVK